MAAYLLLTREQKSLRRVYCMKGDDSVTAPREMSRAVMASSDSRVTTALSSTATVLRRRRIGRSRKGAAGDVRRSRHGPRADRKARDRDGREPGHRAGGGSR